MTPTPTPPPVSCSEPKAARIGHRDGDGVPPLRGATPARWYAAPVAQAGGGDCRPPSTPPAKAALLRRNRQPATDSGLPLPGDSPSPRPPPALGSAPRHAPHFGPLARPFGPPCRYAPQGAGAPPPIVTCNRGSAPVPLPPHKATAARFRIPSRRPRRSSIRPRLLHAPGL